MLQVEGTTRTEAERPEAVRRVRDLWIIPHSGSSRELSVEAIMEESQMKALAFKDLL